MHQHQTSWQTIKIKKITWDEFEQKYRELLADRQPLQNCDTTKLNRICLLCTEKVASQCHRRIAAEYIAEYIPGTEIVHL
ncbi:MAG: DUF488 family protein [Proteobacteria bacterium]|nr:DUF488 family protein [Candidatus Enterousia onthequi]